MSGDREVRMSGDRKADRSNRARGGVARVVTVAAMAGTLLLGAGLTGCTDGAQREQPGPRVARSYADSLGVDLDAMTRRPDGLYVQDVRQGDGARADSGDVVFMHYTGWLPNGTKFDSSRDRNRPLEVAIGYGRVIDGWDRGVVGMKVGGQRRLVIPPELGYGATRTGPIPANSTLVFDLELVDVENRSGPEAAADSATRARTGS